MGKSAESARRYCKVRYLVSKIDGDPNEKNMKAACISTSVLPYF